MQGSTHIIIIMHDYYGGWTRTWLDAAGTGDHDLLGIDEYAELLPRARVGRDRDHVLLVLHSRRRDNEAVACVGCMSDGKIRKVNVFIHTRAYYTPGRLFSGHRTIICCPFTRTAKCCPGTTPRGIVT